MRLCNGGSCPGDQTEAEACFAPDCQGAIAPHFLHHCHFRYHQSTGTLDPLYDNYMICLLGSKASNSSLLAFYEEVMTYNESSVYVTCCRLDGTPVSVTCGQGFSCAASCFSIDASLCPSHNCEACDNFEEEPDEEGRYSIATMGSSAWKWCPSKGCRVRGRSRGCCFNPRCQRRRPRKCAWLQYFAGELAN